MLTDEAFDEWFADAPPPVGCAEPVDLAPYHFAKQAWTECRDRMARQAQPEMPTCKRSYCSWSPPEGNEWCYTHSAKLPYGATICETQATRIMCYLQTPADFT